MYKVKWKIMSVIQLNGASPSSRVKEYKEKRDHFRKEVESEFYSQCVRRFRADAGKEHVLFEEAETKNGVFGNKTLAEAAGYNLDFEVGLESEGTGKLTQTQIEQLKEEYDAENMTEDEYRSLLKELVDMRMLTAAEARRHFARQVPPCAGTPASGDEDPEEIEKVYSGNRLMKSKKEKDYAKYLLDMVNQERCKVNPPDSLEAARGGKESGYAE